MPPTDANTFDYEIDDAAAARIDQNLDLLGEFLAAVVDDPSIIEEASEGSYLFFVPENDPDFAKASLTGAERMARAGHPVHVFHERDWKR